MPEATAPDALCCPISMEIMRDPVICADGHTYERADIEAWLANNRSARRPRCAVNYDDSEPDDDDDEDLELAPPDGEDGWA